MELRRPYDGPIIMEQGLSLCTKCYDWLRGSKGLGARRKAAKKICYACGNTPSDLIKRAGKMPHGPWLYNDDIDNRVLCCFCYRKHIRDPILSKQISGKKILFLRKQIILAQNPKSGICQECKRSTLTGEIKRTNIHHIEYDPKDPLAHTIELCVNCHNHKHPERYRR